MRTAARSLLSIGPPRLRRLAALDQASRNQIATTGKAAKRLAHAVVETGRLQAEQVTRVAAAQTEALLLGMQQQSAELVHELRHQAANEATEHFLVGMNYLNRQDFRRAQAQFHKARQTYAGHFVTLFATGFCYYVLRQPDAAQEALEAALSQTADDPGRARRQRAWSLLYLGRIAFDRKQYGQAGRCFEQAYQHEPQVWTALVEAAASLLLDSSRPDLSANGQALKRKFNQQPPELVYLLWYSLALLLATPASTLAQEAFRFGAKGDFRAREQNRVEVVELLWRLNPRAVEPLLLLVQDEFPWLVGP